ncbi:hypothetical protein F4803DRAFT_508633 [Xylaria telfairii]|nr:hypothetical protein F4803DRAFT_508633 [Xylaria telfairii]
MLTNKVVSSESDFAGYFGSNGLACLAFMVQAKKHGRELEVLFTLRHVGTIYMYVYTVLRRGKVGSWYAVLCTAFPLNRHLPIVCRYLQHTSS